MLDNNTEDKLYELLIEDEEELIDDLKNLTLEDLVYFYQAVNEDILDNGKSIEYILKQNQKYGRDALFSTFRILKAILAEIEYRIKENKI
jgi:hypothetical protein